MESVDESFPAATSDAVRTKSEMKPKCKPADRVSLGKAECATIDRWLGQVNESSRGFLTLTRSDIVNFLVRRHKDELVPKELNQIRADHYDPIRHITWIAPQIKAALQGGNMTRVAELQAELRGVELSAATNAVAKIGDDLTLNGPGQSRQRKTKTPRTPKSDLESSNDSKP